MPKKCDICGENTKFFVQLEDIPPLQNKFFGTVEEAQNYQTTDVEYGYCPICDYMMIHKSSSDQFDPTYDNSDTASKIMLSRYGDVLREVNKFCPDKSGKIVEIGCGRGELLYILQEDGYVNLKGYDPAAPVNNDLIVQRYYWSHTEVGDIDCLIMRHTIEEIPNIKGFLKDSVESLSRNGKMYCEITNITKLKNVSGIFSLYPEYSQLFSSLSLSKLFALCGMSVVNMTSIDGGMRLGVWAIKGDASFSDVMVHDDLEKLRLNLEKCPRPIVIWGAAGRGGNLLSFLKLKLSLVEFVVDVNQEKQGKFVPPFGQQVVSPEDLGWIKPRTILVANKKYTSEVIEMIPSNCSVLDISILSK